MTTQLDQPIAAAETGRTVPEVVAQPVAPIGPAASLLRNSIMLVLSTGATAALSLAFWTLATRLYRIEDVGTASTLISGVSLLTYLSLFGLSSSLVAFLPISRRPAHEIGAAISLTAAGGLVFALGYVLLLPVIAPAAADRFHGVGAAVVFTVVVVMGAVNLVTDSVFIALRAAHWNVVVDGLVQGAAKLTPIALLTTAGTLGILGAFGVGSLAAVLASVLLIRRRLGLRVRPVRPRGALPGYLSFSATSYASSLLNLGPLLILPILVLDTLGARAAAVFYVAFQVATLLNAISFAICESLFAEASHAPERISALARRSAAYTVLGLVPCAVVIGLCAPLVLAVFGSEYVDDGTGLLRLLCLASLAVALNTWTSFLLKIRRRMAWLVASNVVYLAVAVGLAVALRRHHLLGIGWAWLLANVASAVVALVGLGLSRSATLDRPTFAGPVSQDRDDRGGRLRVIQVVDVGWVAGGAERSVLMLRDRLRLAGHEVRVLSTDHGSAGRDLFADVVVPAIRGNPLRRIVDKLFYVKSYRALRGLVRDFEPDVVHLHTVGELSPSVLFALRGTPALLTVHGPEDFVMRLLPWQLPADDYDRRTYDWRDIRWTGRLRYLYLCWLQRPVYLAGLRRCRALIAPSKFMAGVLSDESAPERVLQVYNGVELMAPSPTPDNGAFVYVGRLEAVKGVAVLLEAFARVVEQHSEARLIVVGDGSDRDRLEGMAQELGLHEHVAFTGLLPSALVEQRVRESTAVVIPSLWPENLPTVALEAIGAGRAIIGSDIGGIPELVDANSGCLVPPGDVQALADALLELVIQPELAMARGHAAALRRPEFAQDRFVDRLVDLYRETSTC